MTQTLTKAARFADLLDKSRATLANEPAWLAERRARAAEFFTELGLPTTRHEDWRYTSLARLEDADLVPAADNAKASPATLALAEYAGLDAVLLVFVDGHYRAEYSRAAALPAGVEIKSLAVAIREGFPLVAEHLGSLAQPGRHPFTALAEATFRDGLLLHVPAGVSVNTPIHAAFLSSDGAAGVAASMRNLVVLGAGAQATLIETHAGLGAGLHLKNVVTEIRAAAGARLDHIVLQRESPEAVHVSTTHVHQERGSFVRSHTIDLGGALVRHNLIGDLDGEACEAIFNGLYVLRGAQSVDNFMWVEHRKESIPSHELYKGVLADKASAVFTGRIYVHPEAQKTDAKQTNQNLLLSDSARANARPQLEIYADDVKCTHGATIGQLDAAAQFYLESRGIDPRTARNMLVKAFANDIVERLDVEPIREAVEALLDERLAEMS
jgi:Fe-S cluster assembly protein SufD